MGTKRLPILPYNPGVGELVRQKRQGSNSPALEELKAGFAGWHENGYLPHRDEPGLIQFISFRLKDAFPQELRSEWESLLKIEDARKQRIQLERYLDLGRGPCYLRHPDVARLVEQSLRFGHGARYELRAWVVMPNHVHVLFKVLDLPMWQVVDAWKGFTAKQANRVLGRRGTFWQEGYWDTYMRNSEHEIRTRRYIENNPCKAGLVRWPRDWPWSSTKLRDAYERLCFGD